MIFPPYYYNHTILTLVGNIVNINVNVDQAIKLVELKYMREMLDDGLDVNQLMP